MNIKLPHGISCFLINDVKRDVAACCLGPWVCCGLNLVGVPLTIINNDDFSAMRGPVPFSEQLQLQELLSIDDGVVRFRALCGRVIFTVFVVSLRVRCYPWREKNRARRDGRGDDCAESMPVSTWMLEWLRGGLGWSCLRGKLHAGYFLSL